MVDYLRTAVISTAIGYPLQTWVRYLQPLRRSGFSGDVLLTVGATELEGVPSELRAFARAMNASLFPSSAASHKQSRGHLFTHRFLVAAQWCAVYDFCLTTDFRDVYFQSDPFAQLRLRPASQRPDLLLPLETPSVDLLQCPFSTKLLTECFGQDGRQEVGAMSAFANRSIINAGTFIASPRGLRALAEVIRLATPKCKHVDKLSLNSDQAILNHAVYTRRLSSAVDSHHRGSDHRYSLTIELQANGAGLMSVMSRVSMRTAKGWAHAVTEEERARGVVLGNHPMGYWASHGGICSVLWMEADGSTSCRAAEELAGPPALIHMYNRVEYVRLKLLRANAHTPNFTMARRYWGAGWV